ncbi:MAG: alpha/beta hydrolase, partial [Oscillospiraceae bacterium]
NKVIPRQDEVRVDVSEMADMTKWEEYKKIIHPNKEWLMAQPLEHVTMKARDGITLHADYLPADTETDKLVIGFHGYTSCGSNDFSTLSHYYHDRGYDCLIVDNRAHGKSEGDYIGFGILDRFDCISWVKYINERFGGAKKVLLHGISMGAATILMAAGMDELPDTVKCIVADCGFTSPYDVFAHILKRDYHLPPFPVMNINDMFCRKKAGYGFRDFSTLDSVKKAHCPILFIHGKDDDFVPTEMSLKNYEACTSEKKFLIVENASHAASLYENQKLYEDTVTEFTEKYM